MSRGVYWLNIEPTEDQAKKQSLLEEKGFEVIKFSTLDALVQELRVKRVAYIIVGDEGPETSVLKAMALLHTMPEIQGAKLLLSCSRFSPNIMRAAACEGFRDILPLKMKGPEWLERFHFAIGIDHHSLSHKADLIPLDSPGVIAAPARIIWVGESTMRLEARFFPDTASTILLTGPLVQSFGAKSLALTVKETARSHLKFHFSSAITCEWEDPIATKGNPQILTSLKASGMQPKIKTFLVIQSPALRGSIIKHLQDQIFDVRTALQKKNLSEEPKYYCPDLVICEDRFALGPNMPHFRSMAENLPKHCKIVVIGNDENYDSINSLAAGHVLFMLKRIPVDFKSYITTTVLPKSLSDSDDPNILTIPPDHEFSLAEIRMPAKLVGLSSAMAKVRVDQPIGVYGLVRLEAPLLNSVIGRYPYAKISEVKQEDEENDTGMYYETSCFFCDIPSIEKEQLKNILNMSKSDATHLKGAPLIVAHHQADQSPFPTDTPISSVITEDHPLPKGSLKSSMALLIVMGVALGTWAAIVTIFLLTRH